MIHLFYSKDWDFSRIISLASVQISSTYKFISSIYKGAL